MKTKYKMIQMNGCLIAVMLFAATFVVLPAYGQTKLDPGDVEKWYNDLPVIKEAGLRVDMTKGGKLVVKMQQVPGGQNLLGVDGSLDPLPDTPVWGYKFPGLPATYPGATIVAEEGKRIVVRWENELPGHTLPVDPTLHIAHPPIPANITDVADRVNWIRDWYDAGNVPAVTHLHGGHTESASDGLPEAWFTQGFEETGQYYVKKNYRYDNTQEAATLWYHDHALGITRLNVYAGLAGFYLLRDDNENQLIEDNILPSGDYEIEIVVQDRMFYENGELFLPAFPGEPAYSDFIETPLPLDEFPDGGPTLLAEFFGDVILVNGKAWPKLNVEPRKYRIRLLNGSDSRFYALSFLNDVPWFQIGTDDGFLAQVTAIPDPIPAEPGGELVIAPGERMDLIVDFSGFDPEDAEEFILYNYGPDEPFGGDFDEDLTRHTAQIMKFVVDVELDEDVDDAEVEIGDPLRNGVASIPGIPNGPVESDQQVVLFEGMDEYGRLQPLLGTLDQGSLVWNDAITENPDINETEVWEVINATADAHPIHLHLVAFQILGRGELSAVDENEIQVADVSDAVVAKPQEQHNGEIGQGGIITEDQITRSNWRGPEANEMGWKDTHIVYPNEYSQVRATFDRPGRYVWHCHILSHEDHEMMRPFHVGPIPGQGRNRNARIASIPQNSPNPFNSSTQIRFELTQTENVHLNVFDLNGRMVYQYAERFNAGKHALLWDGFDIEGKQLPRGVYVYRLSGESFEDSKRLIIER